MTKEELTQIATISDLNEHSNKIISEIRKLFDKDKPQFYTPIQFSKITGLPYTTVIHYCKNNQLKARQDFKGSAWLIYASEVERLKDEANIQFEHQ